MARMPAIESCLSDAWRIDLRTMQNYSHTLRESGDLPPSKRGHGAEQVSAPEATTVLLAVSGTSVVKDAPYAVRRLAGMIGEKPPEHESWLLNKLGEQRSFRDAIEFLLLSIPYFSQEWLIGVEIRRCLTAKIIAPCFEMQFYVDPESLTSQEVDRDDADIKRFSGRTLLKLWKALYSEENEEFRNHRFSWQAPA